MLELFTDWIEPFKEFRGTAREKGFFVAVFFILIYVLFTLCCLPFLLIWSPFAFLNEKSKDFF